MPLTERGNTPDPERKPKAARAVDRMAERFGISDEERPKTVEEAYDMVQQHFGDEMTEALKIMVSAVHVAEFMERNGETEDAMLEYYSLLDSLTKYSPKVIRNLLGSGVMAMVAIRKIDIDDEENN